MFQDSGVLIQYAVSFIVNLGSLGAGAWLAWPSLVIKPLLRGDLGYTATSSEIATMVALMDLGNLLTPIPCSYLTDMFGRKPLIHATAPFLLVASLCAYFSSNMWFLYIARLFGGMAKGLVHAAIPLFCAEISHVSIRGSLCTIQSTMVGIGISLTYILGALIPLKYVNALYTVPAVALAIVCFFVPESPYFLVSKGNQKQAEQSLKSYRQYPSDDKRLQQEMEIITKTVAEGQNKKARFIDVVTTKSRRRALMITMLTAIFQKTAGITPFLAYSTLILPETGGGVSRELHLVIFSFVLIAAHNIGTALVELWGRKTLLIISSGLCSITTTILAIFYYLMHRGEDVSEYNWLPHLCLHLFGLFWGSGLCIMPAVLVGELFPMNVKSYASCIISITYGAANFVTNKAFGEITHRFGFEIMFYSFSVSSLMCTLFVMFFVIETKGQTFLEIQRKLEQITAE